jgi:hypothetical protein
MKYLFIVTLSFILFSCKTKPHLDVKLKAEKLADGCNSVSDAFALNSNTNGERYEFQKCLDSNFDPANAKAERRGDTIVLPLPAKTGDRSTFKITMDVDAYPRYHFLTIGENTFTITAAKD